ncbi:hypothetical protein [Phycicoccus sp.]|uniref:hypothetical protein n=1 Tax=Phycicoccus sp. TaxID=1902410 RepID=UPI002CECCFAC|nr:hypothetical protein [Phycicoccus sp.]HMM96699.1 hypothetical protein [Phycicoccus sp.]
MSDEERFVHFAATAAVSAIDRYVNAEDEDRLDDAAAAVSEVLFWWGILAEAPPADESSGEHEAALRFARNCAAHRRLTTRTHEGLHWPRQWPLRWNKRLVWAPTTTVEEGARDLHAPRVQAQRAAYEAHLAGMEVLSELLRLREHVAASLASSSGRAPAAEGPEVED